MCAAPNHPGKPAGCTCSLLHRQRRTAHPPGGKPLPNERNEADSGSLALRPTPSTPAQGRRPPHGGPPRPPRGGHPRPRPGGLHVVRAIHMVNTSQLTSSAKLGLAFRRRGGPRRPGRSGSGLRRPSGSLEPFSATGGRRSPKRRPNPEDGPSLLHSGPARQGVSGPRRCPLRGPPRLRAFVVGAVTYARTLTALAPLSQSTRSSLSILPLNSAFCFDSSSTWARRLCRPSSLVRP